MDQQQLDISCKKVYNFTTHIKKETVIAAGTLTSY